MLIIKQYNKLILPKPRKKASISFIIEETKESVLDFSKGAVKVLWFYFALIKY